MKFSQLLVPLSFLIHLCAFAAEPPPAKALKYHEALIKRPSNDTLFDRFFSAWIDEQDIADLEIFLKARAEENGGANLAILARYQLRRGNENDALETLAKAIASLPEDPSLPMERAKVLLRRLEFENARKDLEKVATGTDPNNALEASKLIGKSYLREGNPEQAIIVWDKLLAANPDDEDLLEDLVESAAAEGETGQALKYVDKLIEAGSDPYKKTLRQLRRGDLLAQAGRHDDAVAAYSTTLAEVGEGSWLEREVLAQIDKSFRKQDRIGELKDKLAELAEANPRRLLIHRELAKLEAAQGDVDAAVGRFREVLKRTPGNRELREEFVRLLTDGEKYEEAATELEKLIALAPEDSGLLLQMANLRHREGNKQSTLAALEKSLSLLGPEDESAGIRISGLMFQYDLGEAGEKLLLKLAAAPNATEAPSEALAAEYARTNRKPEALAILEKIAASENLETVLRAASSISALSDPATALKVLSAKEQALGSEPRFLAAISQAALAAGKPEIALTHAVKLVRLSGSGADLTEALVIAIRAITDADKIDEWRTTLEKQETRTPAETCLLASLADSQSDFEAVSEIMANAKDPVLIRFHAALLDRRGEFAQAVSVLKSLADTDEGRKASYFKDLADLQRRAGLTDDALATVELWKQSAPGDKTAWVTGGSILREEGRVEEAVKSARQAVARFDEDNNLAATLASLHEEAGQMQDAEAIYWLLYDESEAPADQARWAVRLAELAIRTGRTDELEEKLRERSRNNRRSIGPILAQAELARVTQNDDKRRDLMLEAVRLQPKDIDLRLQIANLEEQSGNPERVVAILEEALEHDSKNRIRSALAQAYLRQGQTMKGMRELRTLAGNQKDDPRSIEQSAATLAASGLYEEAIRFLRETLPDGGDWRTKYLLAIMLEHDGRETEAIPIFQTLLQATGELPGTTPPPNQNNQIRQQLAEYPDKVRKILELITYSQSAYSHASRNQNTYRGNTNTGIGQTVGPFILPNTAEIVRDFSRLHLAKLGAEGLENGPFIKELTAIQFGGQPDFSALLEKFPDQPGLFEIVLIYSGWNRNGSQINPDLIKKYLSERNDLTAIDRFRANLILATQPQGSDEAWQNLTSAASEIANNRDEKTANGELLQTGYQLLQILSTDQFQVPEKNRVILSKALLEIASSDAMNQGPLPGFHLAVINSVGTIDQWIEAANSQISKFRKDQRNGVPVNSLQYNPYAMAMNSNQWLNNGSPFNLPNIDTITLSSLPPQALMMIRSGNNRNGYFGMEPIDPAKLLEKIDTIESPVFRAWIAMRAGNEEATEKFLSTPPPENETADFNALRALLAIQKKDFPTAYRSFSELRSAYSSDRTRVTALNFSLIAIASEMSEQQRTEISADLKALLLQARRTLGPQGAEILAAQAKILGLSELAKHFLPPTLNRAANSTPLGAANFGNRPPVSSSGGNASIEKMKKFAADGKNEAAALEALNLIRKASNNSYGRNHELRQIKETITPAVTKELFKLTDPGDSNSLTKLTEYADICFEFGKREEALTILTRLNKERPNDVNIVAKLAFLLPEDQRPLALDLISKAASDDNFPQIAFNIGTDLSSHRENSRSFAFFTTIATWLEKTDPEKIQKANLSWIAYNGKNFFQGSYTSDLQNLNTPPEQHPKDNKDFNQYLTISKRLALAMLRHPSIAEEGFRLLKYSQASKIPDIDMDAYARDALLATASLANQPITGNNSFFIYRTQFGSSSSGDSLDEHSSVEWITSRLATAKSSAEVLPADYLTEITRKNQLTGQLVSALANLSDIQELEKLWKSDAISKASGPSANMLRQGVLSRAGSIPGASGFFLERISEMKSTPPSQQYYSPNDPSLSLFTAALKSSASGDAKDLPAVCAAIGKAIFGEKIDFSQPANQTDTMVIYRALNSIQSLFRENNFDLASSIRIHNAFFKLGIPSATYDYQVYQPFRKLRDITNQQADEIFASFGWLNDADSWQPFSAIIVSTDHNGATMTFKRTEAFLLPQVFSYINFKGSRTDLVKHFENRKPQTFGSLITAASLSSGTERGRLTAKAFSIASKNLSSLPPEKVKDFNPLIPWLPADALAALPTAFRKTADGANAERLAKLIESADAFLKKNSGNKPFDQVEDLVQQLAPLDLDKAVAVFLEAERRFTASLTRGGRLSSYSSSSLQIPERDEALEALCASNREPYGDPAINLAFYQAVVSSPEATRFSFSTSSTNTPIIFRIGWRIHESTAGGSNQKEQQWVRALRNIRDLPEKVRPDAYLALGAYLTGRTSVSVLRQHSPPDAAEDLPAPARTMLTAVLGVRNWKTDKPQDREKTRDALVAIATDPKTQLTTRFQFISIAATIGTAILEDPAIAETFATLFEEYANGERSVINGIGIHSNIVIRIAPYPAADKAILARLNTAFWNNANAPKPGGHPPIPPEFSDKLFVSAAIVGDEPTTKKLLGIARPEVQGNLAVISPLIASGNFALAKDMLVEPGSCYKKTTGVLPYSRSFEQQLNKFRKTPGLDPIALLRIEALFMEAPTVTGPDKPEESDAQREQRLVETYKANPPTDKMHRTEIISRLIRDSHIAAIALRDEILALRKELDLRKSLSDWQNGTGNKTEPIPRYFMAPPESVIFRQGAFLDLLEGDTSSLEELAKIMTEQPPLGTVPANGERYFVRYFLERVNKSAPLWIFEAVHLGKTDGFCKAFDAFSELTLLADKRPEFSTWHTSLPITMAEFFAYWDGDAKKFENLRKQLKRNAKGLNYLKNRLGFLHFTKMTKEHRTWNNPAFAETRRDFFVKSFSRKEMTNYYGHLTNWLPEAAKIGGLHTDFLEIAANPPEGIVPTVLTHLLNYHANAEFSAKRFDSGLASATAAIAACPENDPWKGVRFNMRVALIDRLITAKKFTQAEELYKEFTVADFNPSQHKRHKDLGDKLAKAQQEN